MLHKRVVFLLAAAAIARSAGAEPAPLRGARQLVVVTARGWDAVAARVARYERARRGGRWRPVGAAQAAVVGRAGLAWGSGLHPTSAGGPAKREGDGRSPAGIFRLEGAFGIGAPPRTRVPFRRLDENTECVDDLASAHYNRIVDRARIPSPDWKSSERMLTVGALYRRGLVIAHNAARVPGAGSCIFLHVWGGPDQGTAGCTALPDPQVEALLAWLDPVKGPLIVQLPEEEYARLRSAWGLP